MLCLTSAYWPSANGLNHLPIFALPITWLLVRQPLAGPRVLVGARAGGGVGAGECMAAKGA